MKKVQQGFTLIELMIVVAIIGILAAVAIPAYQDYTIRAQVSEGLSLASGAKTAMAEYYNQRGSFPTVQSSLGLSDAGDIEGSYVSSVNAVGGTNGGIIQVTLGKDVNAQISSAVLEVSAVTSAGSIQWVCRPGTDLAVKYLPTNCR
jgi:type IV pilus assembly protein PilA